MKATARATREERERPNVCLAVASAVSFAPRTVCRRGAVRGVCSGAACWFASGLHTPADAGSIPVPAILDARIRRAPTVARRGSAALVSPRQGCTGGARRFPRRRARRFVFTNRQTEKNGR